MWLTGRCVVVLRRYVGLALQEVTYNQGFYLQTADNFCYVSRRSPAHDTVVSPPIWTSHASLSCHLSVPYVQDGERFRACDPHDSNQRWCVLPV